MIDATTNQVLATVPVATYPLAVCWNEADDKVFCSCVGGQVYVIDGVTNSVTEVLTAGRSPLALLANPLANKVYAANNQSSSVTVFRDSVRVGIGGTMNDERRTKNPGPTVVRGVLFLPPLLLSAPSSLLSIDGRKVLDLHPGANDVSGLSPGVYFIRAVGCKLSAVSCHKVVLAE